MTFLNVNTVTLLLLVVKLLQPVCCATDFVRDGVYFLLCPVMLVMSLFGLSISSPLRLDYTFLNAWTTADK